MLKVNLMCMMYDVLCIVYWLGVLSNKYYLVIAKDYLFRMYAYVYAIRFNSNSQTQIRVERSRNQKEIEIGE